MPRKRPSIKMKFYIEVAAATVLALAFAVQSCAGDDIGDSATGKFYIILFINLETTKGRQFLTCWLGIAKSIELGWEGGSGI